MNECNKAWLGWAGCGWYFDGRKKTSDIGTMKNLILRIVFSHLVAGTAMVALVLVLPT